MKQVFLAVFLLVLIPCLGAVDFYQDQASDVLAQALLDEMTPEEKLGQIFMFSYSGQIATDEILSFIREHPIGGITLYGGNTGDLANIARSVTLLQSAALEHPLKIPLIIGTDQEGGTIRRLREEAIVSPGNMAIGASGLPMDAWLTGYYMGQELSIVGVNMDLAPVVDLYKNPVASVIGSRAFSDDPIETAILGAAFYSGLKEAGIIATAKHYPGHGRPGDDSHYSLPVVDGVNLEELLQSDLYPFRYLAKEDIPAIMVGHISFPDITGDSTPASLSPLFCTEILRDTLGYEGILITDDLIMSGVREYKGLTDETVCETSFRAGSDILLINHSADYKTLWAHFTGLFPDEEFMRRLDESVLRILKVKLDYLKDEKAPSLSPRPEDIYAKIPSEQALDFVFDQTARSVTVYKDARVPITEPRDVLIAGAFSAFLNQGKEYYPDSDSYYIPLDPTPDELEYYIGRMNVFKGWWETIIFCLADEAGVEILKTMESHKERIIVLSVYDPGLVMEVPWVESALFLWMPSAASFATAYSILTGQSESFGRLPFSFNADSQ